MIQDWQTQTNNAISTFLHSPPKSNDDIITLASLYILRDKLAADTQASNNVDIITPKNPIQSKLDLLQSDLAYYASNNDIVDLRNVLEDIQSIISMLWQGSTTQKEREILKKFMKDIHF